ncbi:MAG: class GN sortase [Candidatus Thiodiazotropha sp. (ex Myrtea sp. 'scaly one' KF741663)]|nr:class GN sortase [Candidatus Thiodiazotropha sp. (ex Myrtea sp. 'scaly one' KF741663)]
MMRWATLSLFLLAGICMWQGVWIEAKAWLAQGLISNAWARSDSADDHIPPWSWADTWPVARLAVPRLDVQRIVLAGVSGRTLAFGPGWVEQTVLPGKDGRVMIAGHRDTHFRFLKDLVSGDQLLVQNADGDEVSYWVTEVAVVNETAGWLMGPSTVSELVLVTCYPFDSMIPGGDLRFIVRAQAEPLFPQGEKSG